MVESSIVHRLSTINTVKMPLLKAMLAFTVWFSKRKLTMSADRSRLLLCDHLLFSKIKLSYDLYSATQKINLS